MIIPCFGYCTNLERKLLFAVLRFRSADARTPPLAALHLHRDHERGSFRPVVEEHGRDLTPAAVVERAKLDRRQLRRRSRDWFGKGVNVEGMEVRNFWIPNNALYREERQRLRPFGLPPLARLFRDDVSRWYFVHWVGFFGVLSRTLKGLLVLFPRAGSLLVPRALTIATAVLALPFIYVRRARMLLS